MTTRDAPLAVITVTFSPGRHLDALARSLPEACSRPFIVVCADNGSTDGAPEALAAGREDVEVLRTGGNIGYGAAINAAARWLEGRRHAGEIDGEYFLITNPDVRFLPGSIDELAACLRRRPEAGAVGPRIEEEDGRAYPSAREVPGLFTGIGHALLSGLWPSNPFSAAYRAERDMDTERVAGWLSGSCLMVRWDAFDAVGGFDERYFMYLEDVDFGDRLTRAGWRNVYCPSAVIHHDQGHVAGRHARVTVPAHHASAYRFQADRHPAWWQAPLRGALWLGLRARAALELAKGT
ncbi:alpha-D-GlcNAc-diphosphoryl polyprenol, alpha-3-L-rhamnosyl transferase [Corynebacterium liangguodongii]|uniref:Alpha-D-GlcNAc-diphosphoryl polyprenol, alpha-3-L-rhamnosyl transferase n=1 Tax=Corynebacterium liangguodongii TaxID=2079535 RepID=A0A2S0WCN7_9CORY|nr:glycosyltransferase family 2 protein [Corynebacterium liangguodongii]AWB83533.1 alpha-D-GlcNAc-diphosphoryl polyprenol, alpha-3-L-rhamnosyl transferase [Corynebacterium liangguodongii]PWC00377.1 glycosyltransferase family 2 protein [Corynebacterium liangguodongii]